MPHMGLELTISRSGVPCSTDRGGQAPLNSGIFKPNQLGKKWWLKGGNFPAGKYFKSLRW